MSTIVSSRGQGKQTLAQLEDAVLDLSINAVNAIDLADRLITYIAMTHIPGITLDGDLVLKTLDKIKEVLA